MRYVLPFVVLLAVVAGLGSVKFKQISTLLHAGETAQKAGPPPEVGGHRRGRRRQRGRARSPPSAASPPCAGVAVSNEVARRRSRAIRFESGADGARRARCSSSSTPASSARSSRRREARKELAQPRTPTRSRALVERRRHHQGAARRRRGAAQDRRAPTSARSQAQIERKIVRAPFAGRLGIRAVNLGQYLNPGTPVTVARVDGRGRTSTSRCRSSELASVAVGTAGARDASRARKDAARRARSAPSTRRSTPTTRTVKLRASDPEQGRARSRPGMFVNVDGRPADAGAASWPCRRRRSCTRRTATRCSSSRTRSPARPGWTDARRQAGEDRAPAVRARRRGARRLRRHRRRASTPGQEVVSAGRLQAAQRRAAWSSTTTCRPTPQLAPHPENR